MTLSTHTANLMGLSNLPHPHIRNIFQKISMLVDDRCGGNVPLARSPLLRSHRHEARLNELTLKIGLRASTGYHHSGLSLCVI